MRKSQVNSVDHCSQSQTGQSLSGIPKGEVKDTKSRPGKIDELKNPLCQAKLMLRSVLY